MRQNETKGESNMDINKLRGKMVEKQVNVETLAKMIGTERSALYRKFNNAEKITIGEAVKIKSALGLTDAEACSIFLA